MHILDTDILTHLYAGHPRVIKALRKLDDPDVCTTIVTQIELLHGRFDFILKAATGAELFRAQQLLDRTQELLAQIVVVPFTEAVSTQFDQLRSNNKLKKIGRADLIIASIALTHRATIVTRNVRHFQRVPGLKVVNWID